MLMFECPYCGVKADETELAPGGEAHLTRAGPGAADEEFEAYLFLRENPRGVHFERWRHAFGCGKWFHAARCTVTMEVFGTYPAQTTEPPDEIRAAISARRPGWSWSGAGGGPESGPESGAAAGGDNGAAAGGPESGAEVGADSGAAAGGDRKAAAGADRVSGDAPGRGGVE